jgi:hypothetical protein
MSLAGSLRPTPCASSHVLRQEPAGGTIRAWRGMGTLGWRPPFSTKVSAGWLCDTGAGLSVIRAAAARHRFQTLDFLAHSFVEDGVGQEDQPAVQRVPRGPGSRTLRVPHPTEAACLVDSELHIMQTLASFEPPKFRSERCSPLCPRSRSGPCPLPNLAQSNEAHGEH